MPRIVHLALVSILAGFAFVGGQAPFEVARKTRRSTTTLPPTRTLIPEIPAPPSVPGALPKRPETGTGAGTPPSPERPDTPSTLHPDTNK